MDPLTRLCEEHVDIASALNGMRRLVKRHADGGPRIEPSLVRAMLYYLDVLPERHHHPNEERVLFPAIQRRTAELDVLFEGLAYERSAGEQDIRDLEHKLPRCEQGGEDEFRALAIAEGCFISLCFDHMRREEQGVFPVARRVLTSADLAGIDAGYHQLSGCHRYQRRTRVIDAVAWPKAGNGIADREGFRH